MKKCISVISLVLLLCFIFSTKISAQGYAPGYSDWSEEKTGDENEVSAIQYGRKVPILWSSFSPEKSDSLYQKERQGEIRHYAYNGEDRFWDGVEARELFTWDFKTPSKITWIYIDVDVYVDNSYSNYMGPPLQAYCDGKLVASIGQHNHLENWNPDLNCTCRYLQVNMSSGSGSGRNRTSIVGSWASTTRKEYSHVIKWSEGQDWRFNRPYEEKYGEDSQIPVERLVYSHPIEYKIVYNLDGGTPLEPLIEKYTVLDEVTFPDAYKKGYDFIGFYDERGIKIEKIKKGEHKDYYLFAKYERKAPTIYVNNKYFEKKDNPISIKEFLELVSAKAKDELDGDLSANIIVDYIYYAGSGAYIRRPTEVDLSVSQKIEVQFSVVNSGNKQANIKKVFYILDSHEVSEYSSDNIQIYTRYISSDYLNTIDEDSIWQNEDYQELLNDVLLH